MADIETEVERKRTECCEKGTTLQPFLVFVGKLGHFRSFYVYVNEVRFELKSALDALDLAFKAFYVFDVEYPAFCSNLWKLIQVMLYDIPLTKGQTVRQIEVLRPRLLSTT